MTISHALQSNVTFIFLELFIRNSGSAVPPLPGHLPVSFRRQYFVLINSIDGSGYSS